MTPKQRQKEYRDRFGPTWTTDEAAKIDHALYRMKEPFWSLRNKVEGLEDANVTITIESKPNYPPQHEILWRGHIEVKRGDELIYHNTIGGDHFPSLIDTIASDMEEAAKYDRRTNVAPAKRRATRKARMNG